MKGVEDKSQGGFSGRGDDRSEGEMNNLQRKAQQSIQKSHNIISQLKLKRSAVFAKKA